MEHIYTDSESIQWDLDIYKDGDGFVIHRNGTYFVDLVKDDEGKWIEKFNGPSEIAIEYGEVLHTLYCHI